MPAVVTDHAGEDQYGSKGATPSACTESVRTESTAPVSESGRNRLRVGTEEAFIADAASARRARLKYDTLLESDKSKRGGSTEQSQILPESPKVTLGSSAAERVRSALCAALTAKLGDNPSQRKPFSAGGGGPPTDQPPPEETSETLNVSGKPTLLIGIH